MTKEDQEDCMENHMCRLRISIMTLVILCGMTLSMTPEDAMAGAIVKADGILTSIEGTNENRSVIIYGKGYLVSPSARIVDANGKTIALGRIPLPARVYFHYEYTKTGPVIKFMKVYPKVMPQ